MKHLSGKLTVWFQRQSEKNQQRLTNFALSIVFLAAFILVLGAEQHIIAP